MNGRLAIHVAALAASAVIVISTAAACPRNEPVPSPSSLCGVKDGELIYCHIPPETTATPGMDPK